MEHVESMQLVLLNRANQVLGITNLSKGGTIGTVCDVKLVFQYAINANACGIILAHNHPRGNKAASNEDIKLTNLVKEAGKFFNIPFLDHVILTQYDGFLSMADEGLLWLLFFNNLN
jgi:DNA repair protein RadC